MTCFHWDIIGRSEYVKYANSDIQPKYSLCSENLNSYVFEGKLLAFAKAFTLYGITFSLCKTIYKDLPYLGNIGLLYGFIRMSLKCFNLLKGLHLWVMQIIHVPANVM